MYSVIVLHVPRIPTNNFWFIIVVKIYAEIESPSETGERTKSREKKKRTNNHFECEAMKRMGWFMILYSERGRYSESVCCVVNYVRALRMSNVDIRFRLNLPVSNRIKKKQQTAQIGCVIYVRPDIAVVVDEESIEASDLNLVRRVSCNKRHNR